MKQSINNSQFMHTALVAPWIGNVWGSEGIVAEKFIAVLATLVQRLTVITQAEPDWTIIPKPTNVDLQIISANKPINIPTPFWYNLGGLAHQATTTWQWGTAAASKLTEMHQYEPIDLLVTRYLPLDGIIAGFLFRSQFDVDWLQIFNDPFPGWCQPYYWPISKNPIRILRDLWFQRRLLHIPQAIYSYPSSLMREWIVRNTYLTELDAKRVHVLYHAGIPDKWLQIPSHDNIHQTPIIFRYFGNFYTWRDPGILLDGWKKFINNNDEQCYLQIYTNESNRLRMLLGKRDNTINLTIYDAISYREACRLI